jgi:uncharacterized protein YbjT (DUF2867 family)
MILVTGATGIVGRPLLRLLAGEEVRAVTREPGAANLPAGVLAVRPAEVGSALRGVTAVSSIHGPSGRQRGSCWPWRASRACGGSSCCPR